MQHYSQMGNNNRLFVTSLYMNSDTAHITWRMTSRNHHLIRLWQPQFRWNHLDKSLSLAEDSYLSNRQQPYRQLANMRLFSIWVIIFPQLAKRILAACELDEKPFELHKLLIFKQYKQPKTSSPASQKKKLEKLCFSFLIPKFLGRRNRTLFYRRDSIGDATNHVWIS